MTKNRKLLRKIKKPYLTYVDSYSYYGLWDENFLVFTQSNKTKQLADVLKKVTDIGGSVSTRDAVQVLVVNIHSLKKEYKNLPLAALHHYVMEVKDKEVNIKITYFNKEFKKYIPYYINEAQEEEKRQPNKKIRLEFIYNPHIDEVFMNEKELLDSLGTNKEYANQILKEVKIKKRGFEFNPKGIYAKIVIGSDLYDFLRDYQFAEILEGTGIFFTREDLKKYANPKYYENDDKPNETVLAQLQDILEKYSDIDLFIFY